MAGEAVGARLVPGFKPGDRARAAIAEDPELLRGPRVGQAAARPPGGLRGSPRGRSARGRSTRWGETGARRSELRFLALVHDSLSSRCSNWLPKTGENHHAMRARRFAERYTDDERLLATIELHDRPYASGAKRNGRGR